MKHWKMYLKLAVVYSAWGLLCWWFDSGVMAQFLGYIVIAAWLEWFR